MNTRRVCLGLVALLGLGSGGLGSGGLGFEGPGFGSARAAPEATRGWAARYVYVHDGGRTVGGSGIVVTYRLDLAPRPGRRDCLLRIEGFQSDETIVCKATASGEGITIAFHSFGDGRIVDVYGTRLYDVGATLFEMRRSGDAILTQWRKLDPGGGDASPPPGRYFIREG